MASAGTPASLGGDERISPERRPFEFMLNALRLNEGFALADFEDWTGLPRTVLAPQLEAATNLGWLACDANRVHPTDLGRRFTNDVIELFLER